jgi:glycine/D-amino acid oxidase-like deaminating enzyme
MSPPAATTTAPAPPPPRQHGVKGVYYGGEWLDLEDCDGVYTHLQNCSDCPSQGSCPRSRSRNSSAKSKKTGTTTTRLSSSPEGEEAMMIDSYDVVVIGAGCIGGCVARELSKFQLSVLWVDAADDVSQGATKGNSGIVHAGYDDAPGSVRSRYCWKGNQMYPQLDRELRFGYQKNGSLVLAFTSEDVEELKRLMDRGHRNGVKGLRIVHRDELLLMEPHVNLDAVAALYAPEAGQVIPYEFAIALAENAVDNGVELRLRRVVMAIHQRYQPTSSSVSSLSNGSSVGGDEDDEDRFTIFLDHWEPAEYLRSVQKRTKKATITLQDAALITLAFVVATHYVVAVQFERLATWAMFRDETGATHVAFLLSLLAFAKLGRHLPSASVNNVVVSRSTPLKDLVTSAGQPAGGKTAANEGPYHPVSVPEMLVGGSGSASGVGGQVVATETVRCRFVVNCAGGGADAIARMIGDDSFTIKPRIGDYILLNRNQVRAPRFPSDLPLCLLSLAIYFFLYCAHGNLLWDMSRAGLSLFPPFLSRDTWRSTRSSLVPIPSWARAYWSRPHCGGTSYWAPPRGTCISRMPET